MIHLRTPLRSSWKTALTRTIGLPPNRSTKTIVPPPSRSTAQPVQTPPRTRATAQRSSVSTTFEAKRSAKPWKTGSKLLITQGRTHVKTMKASKTGLKVKNTEKKKITDKLGIMRSATQHKLQHARPSNAPGLKRETASHRSRASERERKTNEGWKKKPGKFSESQKKKSAAKVLIVCYIGPWTEK